MSREDTDMFLHGFNTAFNAIQDDRATMYASQHMKDLNQFGIYVYKFKTIDARNSATDMFRPLDDYTTFRAKSALAWIELNEVTT